MNLKIINGGLKDKANILKGRVALYLITHGSYSFPHLIDMQYKRIMRYVRNVDLKKEHYIIMTDRLIAYIDIGCNNYFFDIGETPNLLRLIEDYQKGLFCAVIIDIGDNTANPSSILGYTVEKIIAKYNIPCINVSREDEKLRNALNLPEGINSLFSDEDDFLTFYPRYVSKILQHIDYCIEYRALNNKMPQSKFASLDTIIKNLDKKDSDDQNISNYISEVLLYRNRIKENERRTVEKLYMINYYEKPKLLDEGIWNKNDVRDSKDMEFAINRLKLLGFSVKEKDNVVCFNKSVKHNGIEYIITADIRYCRKIYFYINSDNDKHRSYYMNFYIMDSWTKNIEEKFNKRMVDFVAKISGK